MPALILPGLCDASWQVPQSHSALNGEGKEGRSQSSSCDSRAPERASNPIPFKCTSLASRSICLPLYSPSSQGKQKIRIRHASLQRGKAFPHSPIDCPPPFLSVIYILGFGAFFFVFIGIGGGCCLFFFFFCGW